MVTDIAPPARLALSCNQEVRHEGLLLLCTAADGDLQLRPRTLQVVFALPQALPVYRIAADPGVCEAETACHARIEVTEGPAVGRVGADRRRMRGNPVCEGPMRGV